MFPCGKKLLLAGVAQIGRPLCTTKVGAPWVDIKAASAGIPCIHRQVLRLALAQDVREDALDALFMELIMLAEADQVLEQAFLVDLRTVIADLHAAPIGLAGHQAIRLQQVRYQGFFHWQVVEVGFQGFRLRRIVVDLDVQAVQQMAFQLAQ